MVAELAGGRFGLEACGDGEGDEEDGWAHGVLHLIVSIHMVSSSGLVVSGCGGAPGVGGGE